MTVYADVLVSLNIILSYILIAATRVIVKCPTNKWAVLLASVIGGVCSLVIFYENAGVVFSFIYKTVTGAVLVTVAFLPKEIKSFIKAYLSFLGVSFLFGGGMYALEITFHPKNIMFYNGIAYFDMSIAYLVGSVLVIYGTFLLGDYLLTRHNTKGGKCQLEITYNNISVSMTAFVDTGNSLSDGMSGRPVIVAELSAVSPLFTREEILFLKNADYENVPKSLSRSFRLIPCRTVTGDSLLKGFLPETVKVENEKGVFINNFCTVAITEKDLSQGEYKALLNNNIFENVKEEKINEEIYK